MLILSVAATAFVFPGTPCGSTKLYGLPIGRGDLIREKLFEVANKVSRLPESAVIAVESTPKSVFEGMYKIGMGRRSF